jgi:hypothetical protein
MKSIIKLFIFCILILLILFLWQEFSNLSLSKKINAEKVSSFFTAIGSLLTAITVFLLYKQIKEQIEDRKASSKPDLYPADQFFNLSQDKIMPKLSRDKKTDVLNGLISIHNIGLGTAKEIEIKWHFNQDVLAPLVDSGLREFYKGAETEDEHSFISANNQMEKQIPLMYISSLAFYKAGWAEMIWEELYLEISYKDIHDFQYPPKIFKVTVYVSSHYAAFRFHKADSVSLSKESTMRSTILDE